MVRHCGERYIFALVADHSFRGFRGQKKRKFHTAQYERIRFIEISEWLLASCLVVASPTAVAIGAA